MSSSLIVGNSGVLFAYNANFNVASVTLKSLNLIDPDDNSTAILESRISVPGANGTFEENGTDTIYLANEYFQFTTIVTDFDEAGQWKICGTYTNTATDPDQIYPLPAKSITVRPTC